MSYSPQDLLNSFFKHAAASGATYVATPEDLTPLEKALLGPDGRPRPVPAQVLAGFSPNARALFSRQHGLYQLVSTELVDFLRAQIGGRRAIEIGCGVGTVGRALGIPCTDARRMEEPEIRALYQATGQPLTSYPAFVERRTAKQAVAHYAPEVVIGCWISQYLTPEQAEDGSKQGNRLGEGVDEVKMLLRGFGDQRPAVYIHVGNHVAHGQKDLLTHPGIEVEVHRPAWLFSRSHHHAENEILICRRK